MKYFNPLYLQEQYQKPAHQGRHVKRKPLMGKAHTNWDLADFLQEQHSANHIYC